MIAPVITILRWIAYFLWPIAPMAWSSPLFDDRDEGEA